LFARIDGLKEQLDHRSPLTSGEFQRLRDEFMVEYTYNSNAIEGNTLTLRETALVLEGVTIDKKPLKDHMEAVGHRDAFLYVQELVQNRVTFSGIHHQTDSHAGTDGQAERSWSLPAYSSANHGSFP
jgi:Fic family protein